MQLQCQQLLERVRAMRLGLLMVKQPALHGWDVIDIDGAYITVGSSRIADPLQVFADFWSIHYCNCQAS